MQTEPPVASLSSVTVKSSFASPNLPLGCPRALSSTRGWPGTAPPPGTQDQGWSSPPSPTQLLASAPRSCQAPKTAAGSSLGRAHTTPCACVAQAATSHVKAAGEAAKGQRCSLAAATRGPLPAPATQRRVRGSKRPVTKAA